MAGQGPSSNDWGVGSTNLEGGGQGGGGGKNSERYSNAAKADWEEQFMRLYSARTIQANTFDTSVKGQRGEGADLGYREVEAQARREQPSVSQSDLFLETRAREKQSLDHQDVPLDYKDAVRRYFDSIEVPKR